MFLWSSYGRRSKSPVKWTNSHVQRQLVGYSIDSDNERVMLSRLNDTNISEACIIVFRSGSKLDTRSGMLWKGISWSDTVKPMKVELLADAPTLLDR